MARPFLTLLATSVATLALAIPAAAEAPLSARNSFRLGNAGVLCTAQSRPTDARLSGLFDRAYLLTCRDAAGAVGSALAVRQQLALAAMKSSLDVGPLDCKPASATIAGLGAVEAVRCRDAKSNLDYLRYGVVRGKTHYLVEGLAGYDPALKLALASLVLDKAQTGVVQVATTEVSDPAAFARTQAGALDLAGLRSEAYVRGNGNRFAESAEFFDNLANREGADPAERAEAIANQGLQLSNLGDFVAASRLLAKAEQAAPRGDGVLQRLVRNYRAINALNQRDPEQATTELGRRVEDIISNDLSDLLRTGLINMPLATLINRESSATREVAQFGSGLTPVERGAVLDAQAKELRGIALRQQGKFGEASKLLADAASDIAKVRGGRLKSARWLSSEIEVERALVSEAQGDRAGAAASFDRSIALMGEAYPSSPAWLAAKARKAAFLMRSGDAAGSRALFAQLVEQSDDVDDAGAALRGLLGPYFDLLSRDGSVAAAGEMFRAAQLLERPGVAQTQAILARQLSAGNDEASTLFRLALSRSRAIARTEAEIAQLSSLPAPTESQKTALGAAESSLSAMKSEQTKLQAKLADFPRYKALASDSVKLADLQHGLRAGEGYYKMMMVDGATYALFVTPASARALKLARNDDQLAEDVTAVRNSIVHEEGGQLVTGAYQLARARDIYQSLFGAIDGEVRGLRHLVFEGDGAMLQLPPSALPATDRGVATYEAKVKAGGDAFDLTGVDWLGKGREMTIAVSPRSFLDIRAIPASHARRAYLGVGSNAVATGRPAVQAAVADDCDWPIQLWQQPISADELKLGQQIFGGASELKTGAAFTDTAMLKDADVGDYRIVHFATHGLVTAPKPGCPARPALVTSFAPDGSDGLLSFKEVFDLKLDADLVILSACDTAGSATVGAAREAGVSSGGDYALDGLVRAFVGAGARSVIASHWPVPDDYDATKRLISGVLTARPGEAVGDALGGAQTALMNDVRTSHPFYWGAFIIIGDAAKPLSGAAPQKVAAR